MPDFFGKKENIIKSNNSEIKKYKIKSDKNGNLILPDKLKRKLGLNGCAEINVTVQKNKITLFPNIHSLAKVYIEPTTLCNLMCQTCVRNTWNEPLGNMNISTFNKIIEDLKQFEELETVMFGGFGEPTFHKDILYMVKEVKSLGIKVEITTNGTLLNKKIVKGLMDNRLDTLWISFDAADENVFEGIRKGASFQKVLDNLTYLKSLNEINEHKINIGLSFVIMKKNIDSLIHLEKLTSLIGASKVLISNVLPYSNDIVKEMVCYWSVAGVNKSENSLEISLPLLDINDTSKKALYSLFRNNKHKISIMGNEIGAETSECRFIKERNTFIRWDGMVTPCMGLMHESRMYPFFQNNYDRKVKSYALGNVNDKTLKKIWDSHEYKEFREKVDNFDFSPCLRCGPCLLSSKNEEDCFGNTFPTCGGCLWAQGVIQCP